MKMLLEQIQIPIGLLKNLHFRSLMIDVILQRGDVPTHGSQWIRRRKRLAELPDQIVPIGPVESVFTLEREEKVIGVLL